MNESSQPTLFPLPPPEVTTKAMPSDPKQGARLRQAQRTQISWGRVDLEASLPEDHPARAICAVLDRLDLRKLYAQVKARDEVAGTKAIDPKILLGLWVYATSEGVGSGRDLARLVELHAAYRWICGGVDVGYHTLNDFRSQNGHIVDELITQVLARLMQKDLVSITRVAQDGTRIRASAGAGSFRREKTLGELMTTARAHLEEVTRDASDPALTARRASAQKRAAKDRLERLEAALAQIPEIEETKKRSGAKDKMPRASTTDADARVMKMGDGGFRPAYNVQFSTTADKARVIVGFSVSNKGSDMGESTPMLDQIEKRTGVRPKDLLVDGGYSKHEAIDEAKKSGITVYAPVPKPRKGDTSDPHVPKAGDSEAVADWRVRMGTEEAKTIYKQRAATAETVNADGKAYRGLDATALRGIDRVTGWAGLFVLTYDVLRLISLGG